MSLGYSFGSLLDNKGESCYNLIPRESHGITLMQIRLGTLMIGRVLVEGVSTFGTIWCHGIARNKTPSLSLSTAEAEYIAAVSCCAQLLWMKQMLKDYGFDLDTLTIFCDKTSTINISKIWYNILGLRTLISVIISLEN